jgi:processing peptidase subunit beta
VRVVSESSSSPLTAVTILIKGGTRDETLETSGVAQLVKRMLMRGTASKSRE